VTSGHRGVSEEDLHFLSSPQRCRDRLGLWDVVFEPDAVSALDCLREWDPAKEERERATKRAKMTAEQWEDVVVADDAVGRSKLKMAKTSAQYLKEKDLRQCLEGTSFTEAQVSIWNMVPMTLLDLDFVLVSSISSGVSIRTFIQRSIEDLVQGVIPERQVQAKNILIHTFNNSHISSGDADNFSRHVLRLFDRDGTGNLNFKEFLRAVDVATCRSESAKLEWAFKLFDHDSDGYIEEREMVEVIEALEGLETGSQGVKGENKTASAAAKLLFDERGNPVALPTPEERARDLFRALDKDGDGMLTMEEFVRGKLTLASLMNHSLRRLR